MASSNKKSDPNTSKISYTNSEATASSSTKWQQHSFITSTKSSGGGGIAIKRRMDISSSSSSSASTGSSSSILVRAPPISSRSISASAVAGNQEPVSILGKGRRYSAGHSLTIGHRHSVKFNELDDVMSSQDSGKKIYEGALKYKCPDLLSKTSIKEHPEKGEEEISAFHSGAIHERSEGSSSFSGATMAFSSTSLSSSATVLKSKTRTADKNSLIASMELKVPSILTPSTTTEGLCPSGGLTPVTGHQEHRGLTILSPHNPCPELHFSSTFTVRTRKGKTIVLPKLRLPGLTTNPQDPLFLG